MAKVLVVDDEPQMREMLVSVLTKAGHTAETAEEGGQALRLLGQTEFDLLLLDILMPGMEGLETLMELRKRHPDVRVIAMSGGSRSFSMDFLPTALKLGARQALKKPFDNKALLAAVDQVLGD